MIWLIYLGIIFGNIFFVYFFIMTNVKKSLNFATVYVLNICKKK